MSHESISVLIATLNRTDDLKKCLDSLLIQTLPPAEVIVVDQSTNNLTKDLVAQFKANHSDKIKNWIYLAQEQKSLVKARNRGIEAASGEILSFLDDDVVLEADYYEKMAVYFSGDKNIAGVSGYILNLPKLSGWKWQTRKILQRIFLINNFNGRMTASGFGYAISDYFFAQPLEVELLHGCDMNFRREAIGPHRFDEWFTGYGYREDADFSYTISQKGQLLMVPDAKLYHNCSPSNRLDNVSLKKMQVANYYHIFRKHKYRNIFSKILFYYSLSGHVFMDWVKFILNFRKEDFKVFQAGILAIFSKYPDRKSDATPK